MPAAPTLFVTPYGRPAATLLHARVAAAKDGDPLRPVSVLVPTNYVGVSVRRLLASGALGPIGGRGAGVAGLVLLTVYRLAELLGAPRLAAAGRRPVSTPLLSATVRGVLRREPGVFAPVADHPSTERALVRAYRELSDCTPAALDTLACGPIERVRHVVAIHRAVRTALAARWYDEADLMAAAGAAIRDGSTVLDDLGTVIVYLPDRLSPPAGALLRTLAGATAVEVVAGMTGAADADADVVRSLTRIGLAVPDVPSFDRPVVSEVVSVSDAEEEARSAVDRVLAAADRGVPLGRIAICYPQPEPYARILSEQLTAAGIEWNGAAVRPLSDRVVGRWLLDLLALDEGGFTRPDVLGLLTAAPVVRADGTRLPVTSWERISREAGIVGGRAAWAERLARYADRCADRADAVEAAVDGVYGADAGDGVYGADAAVRARVAELARERAAHARELAATVAALGRAVDDARGTRTWRGLADWCRRMVGRWISRRRDEWPEAERAAADRIDAALDRLAGLDAAEPATDLETFRRALSAELDDDLGRRGTLGSGVLVGTAGTAFGVDLDVVIVLGLAEGRTPTRPREDSLLPDAARRAVAAELTPRDRRSGTEHRHLLAVLAGARETRVLVFPRGDLRRSTQHAPSRWLADAVQARTGDRALPVAAPWYDEVASYAHRVRTTTRPATPRQHALRTLAAAPRDPATGLPRHALFADDGLGRGAAALVDRAVGRFGRYTGRLTGAAAALVADHVRDRVTSATALEQWLECPHAYLLRYVLGVHPIDNPEEIVQIGPLDRGELIHDVLDRWLRAQIVAGAPGWDQPWSAAAVAALRELTEAALDDAVERGVTGHPVLWARDRARIAADLAAFVDRDEQRRRDARLTPVATELAFGMGAAPPLHVDLADGRTVRVCGRIDRIDEAGDGTVHVADYKTGSADHTGVTVDDPLAGGTRLQLPLYGLALRAERGAAVDVHTEYWFATHRGGGKRIGYRLTDGVVAQLTDALALVADGLEAGLFPRRPPDKPSYGSYVQCPYCDPDGLGTATLRRTWETVRTDPALRAYVAAVEPDALVPDALAPDGGRP